MVSLAEELNELLKKNKNDPSAFDKEEINKEEDYSKISTIHSMFAGVGSGLISIPKGLFSLGATLMDLGADTNKAAEVEKWFDDVNPWDDEAEARTVGRITQALAQIAIPATYGFKAGSAAARAWQTRNATSLAQKALAAKKNGKYFLLHHPNE